LIPPQSRAQHSSRRSPQRIYVFARCEGSLRAQHFGHEGALNSSPGRDKGHTEPNPTLVVPRRLRAERSWPVRQQPQRPPILGTRWGCRL